MGHIDHGGRDLLMEALDLAAHFVSELRVEIGQRLVEQEDPRIAHHGAPDRDALTLAAGELARIALKQRAHSEHTGDARHALLDLLLGHSTRPQTERNVAEHGHVRIERVVLEHHRDIAVARTHVIDDLAADFDLPGVGVLKPGDGAQKGALATSGRSDQHREFAVRDVEIDATDGVNRSVALVKGANSNVRHGCSFSSSPDRAEGEPAHQMALDQHAENNGRHERRRR